MLTLRQQPLCIEHTYGRHAGQTSKHMHRAWFVVGFFFSLCSTCARPTSLITATGVFDSSDTERSVTGPHLFISTSSLRIKIFPLSDLLSPNSTCATVLNPQPRLCFFSPQLPPCFYWLFLPQTPSAGKVLGCISIIKAVRKCSIHYV